MRSKLGLLVASLLTIPLISAQTWGRYGSPFDYFDNEWVKFTIVLLVLFFLIYYFVHKKTDNTPVSVIVGLGIALLLTIALTKRGILDNFLEETIVDWVLIIAVLFVIFFLFYKLAFKEDMYGYRRFSLWRFIFALILIALIPLFIELEEILPESLMYGPFLDFIELLQGFSSFIFIGLGVLIIYFVFRTIFRGGRRVGRGWGRGRARRPSWRQRRRDRRTTQQPQRPRSFRQVYKGARRTNREAEQRANLADWARKEDIRKQGVAGKWKSKAITVQKRDAEKQVARQAKEQAQRQAEQERAQRIYAKQQEKARAIAEQRTRREQEKARIITQKQRAKAMIMQKRDAEKQVARQAKEQAQRQAEQERTQRIRLEQIKKRNIVEGRRAETERNKSYKEKLKQERLMYARKDKKISREQELKRQQEEHNKNIQKYIKRTREQAKAKAKAEQGRLKNKQ